nr:immunoglobulin light chain junction region [Macaca mulatta]MOW67528.1 immunoglobulin light chain junction region [Macaca mulatta]MOW67912.1 immunoglobulin light chain junction region [Macaca mulatta]MOW67945.1 immunoglobulin light chain junction region [Macaca mulatta]MOW68242.1 immunoglobulin light chain junction region [Macaca mulatta]
DYYCYSYTTSGTYIF